jgi:hypothetical protein
MARSKNRRAKGKTEIDWSQVKEGGGGFQIPEGNYKMRFEEVTRDESKDGNDMLVWDFVGLEGKAKKKTFRIWTSLLPDALWKLGNLLDAMGIERPDSVEDIIETVEAEDPAPVITGVVTDDEYQDKIRSKVSDFLNAEGEGGSAGDGEEKPDVDEMDEDDLAKLVKKKKLDVDLDDFKTIKKKRAAVAEALEAEDGEGDEDKLTKDKVNEMDEDELAAVIKEHKLKKDVDLDDHKTIKKKRAALIEVLEEKELLEDEEAGGGDEGNKRRGKKGGDKAKLSKDEVNEMDEDELADCNKTNKLKVDLDDFRTIKKKRAAIIEALEEKDLLDE